MKKRRMGRICGTYEGQDRCIQVLVERPDGKSRCYGMILLKWISKKLEEEACTGLYWLRIWKGGRCL
jgi:hypothetical protein